MDTTTTATYPSVCRPLLTRSLTKQDLHSGEREILSSDNNNNAKRYRKISLPSAFDNTRRSPQADKKGIWRFSW